MKYINIVYG